MPIRFTICAGSHLFEERCVCLCVWNPVGTLPDRLFAAASQPIPGKRLVSAQRQSSAAVWCAVAQDIGCDQFERGRKWAQIGLRPNQTKETKFKQTQEEPMKLIYNVQDKPKLSQTLIFAFHADDCHYGGDSSGAYDYDRLRSACRPGQRRCLELDWEPLCTYSLPKGAAQYSWEAPLPSSAPMRLPSARTTATGVF